MSLPLPMLDRGAVLPVAPLQRQAMMGPPVEGLVKPKHGDPQETHPAVSVMTAVATVAATQQCQRVAVSKQKADN